MEVETNAMFLEWRIMSDALKEFRKLLISSKRLSRKSKPLVYAVGSPRNFNVIVEASMPHFRWRKVFRRDIRDGSANFWLEEFDRHEWIPVGES